MGKKDDILDAALELITDGGILSITFAKIFKMANVGSGTFYNYFSGKEELVAELYKRCFRHYDDYLTIESDPNATVFQKFKTALTGIARFGLENPAEIAFMIRFVQNPILPEDLGGHQTDEALYFNSIIREGQDQGLIVNLPTLMVAELAAGMITSTIKGAAENEYELSSAEIEQLVNMAWKAIKL